ncbi:MAG TPA: aminoacyl-tRNA hydrolase [Clostridia bacterium]|nr:aminoacyl-tRNA hydrolase [Clostridia bacterium]
MILIVGLGNPGKKYEKTRHNVGFMVLDSLLQKLTAVKDTVWKKRPKLNSLVAKAGKEIILAKPQSFMNASGKPVVGLMKFYKIPVFGLYLVHDDVDLPLGKIKISSNQGSAGHRGVESVIKAIGGKNFVRVRVGIGEGKKIATEKFVLSPFFWRERGKLNQVVKKATEAMEMILKEGVERTAARYNQ